MRSGRRLAATPLVVLAMAACSGSSDSASSVPPTSTPATTAPTSPTSATPSSSPPAVELCAPTNTRIRFLGTSGAAGTEYSGFRVTNVGTRPCHSGGYPGAQLLDRHGDQLPTKVVRQQSSAPGSARGASHTFVVPVGGTFGITLAWSSVEPNCDKKRPPAAPSMRITLPDNEDSASVSLRHSHDAFGPITACHGRLLAFRVYDRKHR